MEGESMIYNILQDVIYNNTHTHEQANKIIEVYSESWRKYHNLSHIMKCLDIADELVPYDQLAITHSMSIKTIESIFCKAIIYHDYIYNSLSETNEVDSAKIMIRDLSNNDITYQISIINNMILSTTHDQNKSLSLFDEYMCDIDLHQLGCKLNEFLLNENNIRKEYSVIKDEFFYPSRVKILQKFLNRNHIYYTTEFRNKFEKNVRGNLMYIIKKYNELGLGD